MGRISGVYQRFIFANFSVGLKSLLRLAQWDCCAVNSRVARFLGDFEASSIERLCFGVVCVCLRGMTS